MRSLIIFFLLNFSSFAYYQTAGINFTRNNKTNFSNSTEVESGSVSTTALSYGIFDVARYHSFNFSYQQRYLPYDKMKVLTGEGELEPLSQRYGDGPEHWVSFGHDFSMGDWNISTSLGSPIGKVPYSRQNAGVSIRYGVTDRTILLGAGEYQLIKRPESYGTKSNQETIKLPENVNFSRFVLGVEQIVTSRIKMSISGETAVYEDERPRHFGYATKLASALFTSPFNTFFKAGHTYRKEVSSDALYTIGGHLEYRSTFTELTIEPLYDLLFSLSYQLVTERQNEQEVGRVTQLAYDQFGTAVSYDWDDMKTTLKGSYLMPNSEDFENQMNLEGGVEWTF